MGSRIVTSIGTALAAWMAAGRWLFGIGGSLTWWYLLIGVAYAALQFWLGHRIAVTRARGHRTRRATIVALVLSWVSTLGFGLTVPDLADDRLVSVLSLFGGSALSSEMSIALCNPLGIISFALAIAALAFAYADARDPRPEEDELDTGASTVAPHPLA